MLKDNTQRMLIDATQTDEVRVALTIGPELLDFDFETLSKKPIKGNIYLGKIVRVEPSLQAAFIEYGRKKHGFLAFTEIHPDYFRIPVADRDEIPASKLQEEKGIIAEDINEHIMATADIEVDATSKSDEGSEEDQENIAEADIVSEEKALEIDSAEEDVEVKKKYAPYRQYKLQEVIKSKQVVLVQVVKEERGNKGAALTTFISLAGRYCVLMPNSLHPGGISRKITEINDRKRLKQLIEALDIPEGMSLIVRTAGLDRSKAEIRRDYEYLIKLWARIRENTLKAIAPALVYEEPNLVSRAIRDLYTPEIDEILIEGSEAFKEAKDFMKVLMPTHVKKINAYADNKVPLFQKYQIEHQIEQIYSPQVKLRSGGYIVISMTEALVAIDVNSGRATRERHIDTTALKTNLEAAEEVARQVRIRDLSGLIVIDFIDMSEMRHNIAVEKRLRDSLAKDRARIQVGRISQFGLLEMSRQRLRPSIMESSSVRCPYCVGAGMVRSNESLSLQLLRVLEELSHIKVADQLIYAKISPDLGLHLLETKRHEMSTLEERHGRFFILKNDESLQALGFRIETQTGEVIADSSGHKEENASSSEDKIGENNNGHRNQNRPLKKKKRRKDPRDHTPVVENGEENVADQPVSVSAETAVVETETFDNIGNRVVEEQPEDQVEDNIGNRIEQIADANKRHSFEKRGRERDRNRGFKHEDRRRPYPPHQNGPKALPQEKNDGVLSLASTESQAEKAPVLPREKFRYRKPLHGQKKSLSHEGGGETTSTTLSSAQDSLPLTEDPKSNRRGWWKKLLDN